MLKKTRRTQFFEYFEYFDNLLIINVLWLNSSFLLPNHLQNPSTFQFLFRHTFKTVNYTLLNISVEVNCLFLRSPLLLFFQRTVVKFSAHSERISTALQIKLQCAENVTTVR